MSYCTCPPELRGRGRCNHIAHQNENESAEDFCKRIEELQENQENNVDKENLEKLTIDEKIKNDK